MAPTLKHINLNQTSLVSAVAVLLMLAAIATLVGFTAEDAFIVFRYSRSLVETGELVYNPGVHVSALTSPLQALVDAGLYTLSEQLVGIHKIAGVSMTIVAVGMLFRSVNTTHRLFVLALLSFPPIWLWAGAGLETPILTLVLTVMVLNFGKLNGGIRPASLSLATIGITAGLAFITRYDSILLTGPILVMSTVIAYKSSPLSLLNLGISAAVLPLGWMAWAFIQFDTVFPTSVYVKSPSTEFVDIAYTVQFLFVSGLVFVAVAIILKFKSSAPRIASQKPASILIGISLIIFYGFSISTTHMMFSYRMFVPYLIPTAIMLVNVLGPTLESPQARRQLLLFALVPMLVLNSAHLVLLNTSTMNFSLVGEYRQIAGINEYTKFIEDLERTSLDIAEHAESVGMPQESITVSTFAAGMPSWVLDEATVLSKIVSYRPNCNPFYHQFSDYIHIVTPRHGSVSHQIQSLEPKVTLISDHTSTFDGAEERWLVYYNPDPLESVVPSNFFDPCKSLN